jgi:hypothetical protein
VFLFLLYLCYCDDKSTCTRMHLNFFFLQGRYSRDDDRFLHCNRWLVVLNLRASAENI